MKNTNELKPLFRNVDIIPNPLLVDRETTPVVETKSFYNILNQTMPSMMVHERPVDKMDLDIIRHNLCVMFENRAKNILLSSARILYSRLDSLENRVRKFLLENTKEEFHIGYAVIDVKDGFNSDRIVDEIVEKLPYITDLMFYFNISDEFTSIKTMALTISTMIYNKLRFELADDNNLLTNEEVEMLNEVINGEFKKFTNSIIDDLHILHQEAQHIYFTSGDYVVNENGEVKHYLNQDDNETETIEAIPVSKDELNRIAKLAEVLQGTF